MEIQWNKIKNKLKKELDANRFEHTQGVMYTASCLAMAHGIDMERARIAGLLHDCAKCIPNRRKIDLCEKAKLPVSEFEKEYPFLLHAKLGAYLAEKEYGVRDREVLSSILWHTTGKPAMSDLEKIIYIADYIEPNRNKAPHLEQVRRLAFDDLDSCMCEILEDTVSYLSANPKSMDKTTLDAYDYYKTICGKRTGVKEKDDRC